MNRLVEKIDLISFKIITCVPIVTDPLGLGHSEPYSPHVSLQRFRVCPSGTTAASRFSQRLEPPPATQTNVQGFSNLPKNTVELESFIYNLG